MVGFRFNTVGVSDAISMGNNKGHKWGIPLDDCRKLLSVISHQEKARKRKIRWLLEGLSNKELKKLKKDKYVPESFMRSKDVLYQKIKNYIETNSRSSHEYRQTHHEVLQYARLFDTYSDNPSMFFTTFSSALKHMRSDVLNHVAQIITDNKITFDRTRKMMIKDIEENIHEVLSQQELQIRRHEIIKQLSLIFRNHDSFQRSHLTLVTPVTPSLLVSITEALMELEDLPYYYLEAMKRRINGVRITPKLCSGYSHFKKADEISRLRKQCDQFLDGLKEGDELPKPLAKALSVVTFHKKHVSGRDDMKTTEFFPFSPEVERLQSDIFKAIWSIPKLKTDEFRTVQRLLDPNAKLKSSRAMVMKYFVEYLLESVECDVPESFRRLVAFICRKSGSKMAPSKKQDIEELELVLNVSNQLRQVAFDSVQNFEAPEAMEDFVGDDDVSDDESDDILIDANENCIVPSGHGRQPHSIYPVDYGAEGVGESRGPSVCASDRITDSASLATRNSAGVNSVTPKIEQNKGMGQQKSLPSLAVNSGSTSSLHKTDVSYGNAYKYKQDICDETSLLAHGLISQVIKSCKDSKEKPSPESCYEYLVEAVEELIPSLPKSDVERLKIFMGTSE